MLRMEIVATSSIIAKAVTNLNVILMGNYVIPKDISNNIHHIPIPQAFEDRLLGWHWSALEKLGINISNTNKVPRKTPMDASSNTGIFHLTDAWADRRSIFWRKLAAGFRPPNERLAAAEGRKLCPRPATNDGLTV